VKKFLIPCLFILVFSRAAGEDPVPAVSETIRFQSFNLRIFGRSKMAKPAVAGILADIVSRADLIALQELRSISPEPVLRFMELLPGRYKYVTGPREGRSVSKEQFWIIYDSEKLLLLDGETWPDPEGIFERKPLGLYFRSSGGSFDFILINNHIRPRAAGTEIPALPDAAAWFQSLWDEKDVILAGDFNADGAYYDESLLDSVFPAGEYHIIIPHDADTTLALSENTYDRFIITSSAFEDYAGSWGVLRFDEVYDFDGGLNPGAVSDHYPIWADFAIDRDTD
jgi:endonuclease/exonuclease/phosphatase family metal-dependent hydrolase